MYLHLNNKKNLDILKKNVISLMSTRSYCH